MAAARGSRRRWLRAAAVVAGAVGLVAAAVTAGVSVVAWARHGAPLGPDRMAIGVPALVSSDGRTVILSLPVAEYCPGAAELAVFEEPVRVVLTLHAERPHPPVVDECSVTHLERRVRLATPLWGRTLVDGYDQHPIPYFDGRRLLMPPAGGAPALRAVADENADTCCRYARHDGIPPLAPGTLSWLRSYEPASHTWRAAILQYQGGPQGQPPGMLRVTVRGGPAVLDEVPADLSGSPTEPTTRGGRLVPPARWTLTWTAGDMTVVLAVPGSAEIPTRDALLRLAESLRPAA